MVARSWRLALAAGVALLLLSLAASMAHAQMRAPILTTLARTGRFTDFLHAVNAAGLAATLHGPGPITVFAPDDDAFAKLAPAQRDELMSDPKELRRMIEFDIVPGRITQADLGRKSRTTTPKSLEGDPLRAASAVGVVTVNGAPIVRPDIHAKNGVIQELGTVLMPPIDITAPPGKYVAPRINRALPAPVRPPKATLAPSPTHRYGLPGEQVVPGVPRNAPRTPAAPNPPSVSPTAPRGAPGTPLPPTNTAPAPPPTSGTNNPPAGTANPPQAQPNSPTSELPGENGPPQ